MVTTDTDVLIQVIDDLVRRRLPRMSLQYREIQYACSWASDSVRIRLYLRDRHLSLHLDEGVTHRLLRVAYDDPELVERIDHWLAGAPYRP